MINLDIVKNELVTDAVDTCLQDSGYLRSVVQNYFESFDEPTLRKMHADAFDRNFDIEDDQS